MAKLLVNAPTGEQQLLEVGVGGGYFDASRVLWDERVDGPLPPIALGGMRRENDILIYDAARMAEHTAVLISKIQAALTQAVQNHLDAKAKECGYDSILSACSYAGAPNPYQSEGVAFLTWRGACWNKCYQILTDVQSGLRTIPTEAKLLAELPVLP